MHLGIKKIVAPLALVVASIPVAKNVFYHKNVPAITCIANDVFVKSSQKDMIDQFKFAQKMLDTMKIDTERNFRGGLIKKFSDINVEKLKNIIQKEVTSTDYCEPIKNDKNVYTEPFGFFFAKRSGGRPHLGLDIFVTKNATKPKTPVVVVSPIDGIVISQKRARKNDNVIANCVTILGVDGKRYGFDHLARATDYKDSIALPSVGKIMNKGDSIGYVGATGETDMWHLHTTIMTDERLQEQNLSTTWKNLSKASPYTTLKGQVDPLNKDEAGYISEYLNQYQKSYAKGQDSLLLPYPNRESYLK